MNWNENAQTRLRPPRPDAGMGLAETMISLVIVTTAVLGMAGTSARVGSAVNTAHLRTQALVVAQHQVEELMATPYDQVVDGSATVGGVTMNWQVTELDEAHEIVLIYQYDSPRRSRADTLTAAYRQP